MPTSQYTALANITLSSAVATVTFSNINQTYRDLVLVGQVGAAAGGNALKMQFNGDTASNYSSVTMAGNGSSPASYAAADTNIRMFHHYNPGSNLNNMFTLNIMDYSSTTKHKTTISKSSSADGIAEAEANRWGSTAAITSLTIFWATSGNNILSGTSLVLYGVK